MRTCGRTTRVPRDCAHLLRHARVQSTQQRHVRRHAEHRVPSTSTIACPCLVRAHFQRHQRQRLLTPRHGVRNHRSRRELHRSPTSPPGARLRSRCGGRQRRGGRVVQRATCQEHGGGAHDQLAVEGAAGGVAANDGSDRCGPQHAFHDGSGGGSRRLGWCRRRTGGRPVGYGVGNDGGQQARCETHTGAGLGDAEQRHQRSGCCPHQVVAVQPPCRRHEVPWSQPRTMNGSVSCTRRARGVDSSACHPKRTGKHVVQRAGIAALEQSQDGTGTLQ